MTARREHWDNWLRVRKYRGMVGTSFWLVIAEVLFWVCVQSETTFADDPTLLYALGHIRVVLLGGQILDMYGVFRVLLGLCLFKAVDVWFDGVVVDVVDIVVTVVGATFILVPVNGFVVFVQYESFRLDFSVFLFLLFAVQLTVQFLTLFLDWQRFGVDDALDAKYGAGAGDAGEVQYGGW
ncbi:MAG: hypothetical protein ACTSU5_04540 [Promethearchaeota archaeon]